MSAPPRRFYAACEVVPTDEGFAIRLDGKPPKSPGGRPLVAPTLAIARLVEGEWAAQGERIEIAAMPATRLLHTALDAIPGRRAEIAAGIAAFAGADAICYFAAGPSSLIERQRAAWRPLLEWARIAHGLTFVEASGIRHIAQPSETLAAVEAIALACDDFALAALAFGAALFGSAILALALRDGRISGQEAFDLSRLDEAFQEERWGVDVEAAAARARREADAVMVGRWFGQAG
jgi:chaperone required for assembly of F1-ATPase